MCEKLAKMAPTSQKIGEFLDWLREQRIYLAVPHHHTEDCEDRDGFVSCGIKPGKLFYHHEATDRLLARFFEIDLDQVERERRELLEELRRQS